MLDENFSEANKIIEIEKILQKKKFSIFLIRCFDIIASFFGILLLLPMFILISLLILIQDGKPVLFRQKRIGKNGKSFFIMKYRTMTVKQKIDSQITVGDDVRITKIGKVLRKLKIDELPQLFNVFAGQMSFVGPRPEVEKYVNMYSDYQKCILKIRPGITEEASLKYYNESDLLGKSENPEELYVSEIMPDKIDMNIQYIKKMGLFYNLGVILKTIFRREKKK